mmetsp:Transcript_39937/g.66434  ORF Transcript_39937/g.66434 Transcript_39937/m.66434 type:complete len:337 (-) Transcript_39937:270-1280(-)
MERHPEPGRAEHGQVVGPVPHGDGLAGVDPLLLRDGLQKVRLRRRVHDLPDDTARHDPVHDLQFVGVHVVEPEDLLQVLCEVREASGQDGRLEAHPPQCPDQPLGALREGQAVSNDLQCRFWQSLQHRHPLLQALPEVDLAPHGRLSDGCHLISNPGLDGQLVNHFVLDQSRVHVEHRQTPEPPVDVVLLKAQVNGQFAAQRHQLVAQACLVWHLPTEPHLDAGAADVVPARVQRVPAGPAAPRQSRDDVDVEVVLDDQVADGRQVLPRQVPGQQREDPLRQARLVHPFLVLLVRDGLGVECQPQLMGGEQQVLRHRGLVGGLGDADHDPEHELLV